MLPTSRPRVGWSSTSIFGSPLNSRATTAFCWLPPDRVSAVDRRGRRPDVEALDELLRPVVDRGVLADRAAGERRPVVAGQDEVVLEREAHDHRPAVAVARDVGEAGLVELPGAPAGHVGADHRDAPGARLAQAGEHLDQLVLAVAGDAGDAEGLAGPDLEVDPADDLPPAIVLGPEPAHRQDDVGRVRHAPIDRQLDVPADHQLGQVLLVRRARDPLARRPGRAG